MGLRHIAIGVVGIWLAVGGRLSAQQTADLTLVPVVGNWQTTTENGRRILTADGTAVPLTAAAALRSLTDLFGPRAEVMAKNAAGAGAFPLAIAREIPNVASGRIRAEFKLLRGATDQTAGIVFGLKDDGTYQFGRYNTKDGNVAIWTFQDGTRTVLSHGEAHKQLAAGEWHDLAVTIQGREVTVSAANDTLRVTHTFPSPISGRIGFWTKTDSVTAFRGLAVEGRGAEGNRPR